jgi:hypothetical protein
MLVRDAAHPYRYLQDQRARQFAQRFWTEQARDAEVACLRWDFKVMDPQSLNAWAASYLCNQWIYSPMRRAGGPRWDAVSASHPLRCVLYNETPADSPYVAAWLVWMTSMYDLRRCDRQTINLEGKGVAAGMKQLVIYEFVPRAGPPGPALAGRSGSSQAH